MKALNAKTFAKKGQAVVDMNNELVDAAADACVQVKIPASLDGVPCAPMLKLIPDDASDFAKKIIEPSMRNNGDAIPVSAMSLDGTLPTGTAALEKRGFAPKVPRWNLATCIQCGICASSCPHAAIRTKLFKPADMEKAPATFQTKEAMPKADGLQFKVQVYVEDCMGCGVCLDQCPVNQKALKDGKPENAALVWSHLEAERAAGENENEKFFESTEDNILGKNSATSLKGAMLRKPLFEFSGACAGCGETPYVKLASQLFGEKHGRRQRDRMLLNLLRNIPDHPIHQGQERTRPRMGKLPLRGQRGVRLRNAPRHRFEPRDSQGIDHVVAMNRNVNILVLDTEVYSNTGGQASKATPTAAVAKFAAGGKRTYKKNMGFMCMSYGYVYVASVALGYDRNQTLKAFQEAEAYNGPSIIFAYAPCIAHTIDMSKTQNEQKRAVEAGYYPVYRFNPAAEADKRFSWDVKTPANGHYQEFIMSEGRYKLLTKANPAHAAELFAQAEKDAAKRMEFIQNVGKMM